MPTSPSLWNNWWPSRQTEWFLFTFISLVHECNDRLFKHKVSWGKKNSAKSLPPRTSGNSTGCRPIHLSSWQSHGQWRRGDQMWPNIITIDMFKNHVANMLKRHINTIKCDQICSLDISRPANLMLTGIETWAVQPGTGQLTSHPSVDSWPDKWSYSWPIHVGSWSPLCKHARAGHQPIPSFVSPVWLPEQIAWPTAIVDL